MAKSFHFSYGNSTMGPIGFCARVIADSREEALAILKQRIWANTGIGEFIPVQQDGEEYVHVYFGIENLLTLGIDSSEEEESDG